MAHVPHLLTPRPWRGPEIELHAGQMHHLHNVLRMNPGEEVSYTDGDGLLGRGVLGTGVVMREGEHRVPSPDPEVTMAVAPPAAKDRARFLVEKLAELGVAHLVWLRTRRGEGRPPSSERCAAWAGSALEQSRGAWLMKIDAEPRDWTSLPPPVVVADRGGQARLPAGAVTVAIGPEGGWADGEVPADHPRVSLGSRVLRVETAALAVAARLLAWRI